ncbi:MAG: alpha-ketoglutarate-dependent 2,4-dichlorophenoxyacetate dioxygenase [Gammaproteobacteria bacterium]|jgi:alpha-ketoglutarate-dependent 2,4-dichlorophenoxyacetate dioxygenase
MNRPDFTSDSFSDLIPLHSDYGVQIDNVKLSNIGFECGYSELRSAFETHSLLYFPNQDISDEEHLCLGSLFGLREDRTLDITNPDPAVSIVSNVKEDNKLLKPDEKRHLDLQANMLWHTDSTFLPVPALTNILIGRVIPKSGTSTEFCSTRIAWQEMPESLNP